MRSIGELLLLLFSSKWFLLKEEIKARRIFSQHKQWQRCDRALRRAYCLQNPYRISKQFLRQRRSKEIHLYGETPLTSLDQIAKESGLHSTDHLFELGSGRGRGAFFLALSTGCRVTAIEWIPAFTAQAKAIQKRFSCSNMTFICADMREVDFTGATVIYLYGTCLEDEVITHLIASFKQLPSSTQLITVSYPLSDYDPAFSTTKQFLVAYPWGEATVYVQRRIS